MDSVPTYEIIKVLAQYSKNAKDLADNEDSRET